MSIVGNNDNAELSYVRDAFFTKAEEEYFERLLQDPDERELHCKMLRQNAKALYKKAMELIDRVEAGEFNEQQMIKAERAIAHLLAGIEDFHKELVLELTL